MTQKWFITTKKLENISFFYSLGEIFVYRNFPETMQEKLKVLIQLESEGLSASLGLRDEEINILLQTEVLEPKIEQKINHLFAKYLFPEITFSLYFKEIPDLEFIDIYNVLTEIDFEWSGPPVKEVTLIEKYDYDAGDDLNALFHNMRHEYIFIGLEKVISSPVGLFFLGVSLKECQLRMKIKAFNPEVLISVAKKIEKKIQDLDVNICNSHGSLGTEILKSLGHQVKTKDSTYQKFLDDSLKPQYKDLFEHVFLSLEDKGYLTYADMRKKFNGKNLANYKQLTPHFLQYLKLDVENRFVLLYQDTPRDFKEIEKKSIFTLSARLYQYFLQDWFEDYFGTILKSFAQESDRYKVLNLLPNWEYEFAPKKKREIDWVFEVQYGQEKRIVAVDCKKTISPKTINNVKISTESSLLSTQYYDLIDIYINVGYFLSKNEKFKNTFDENGLLKEKVRAGTVEKDMISFTAKSFEEMSGKLNLVFESIFL